MSVYIEKSGLKVDQNLVDLLENQILAGLTLDDDAVWKGLSELVSEFAPLNKALLAKRDEIQAQIDTWHQENQGADFAAYKSFLQEIGYLVPEGEPFQATTEDVDAEIASIAGAQLVVPVNNARFALNAANARWGSLYDAFYGTDAISEEDGLSRAGGYNEKRGAAVIEKAAAFLDGAVPLQNAKHLDVKEYRVVNNQLSIELSDGSSAELADNSQYKGFVADGDKLTLLFANNGLHIEVLVDRDHPIGSSSLSGVKDIVLESAVSTIMDCEDSVAAVDGEDKALVYSNWLGLMKGDLQVGFEKGGKQLVRKLNADRQYTDTQGGQLSLHGRSLLLVRNVGHLMTTPAVLDADGNEIPEGMLDALFTAMCAMHDLQKQGNAEVTNSRKGSIYIVKPKMHGPEEAAFTNRIFSKVEDILKLPRNTMKVGVMDEERRTTANLKECIRAVKERIVFINTGFLDRTGDEIHTSMQAGAFLPKDLIKQQAWLSAYENWNVDIGIECGLRGRAQIGKGMWPKPDDMAQMLATKADHPNSGANTAWVPSPTAATLHATHYHQIDVFAKQEEIAKRQKANLDDILTIPLLGERTLSEEEIEYELDNNCQSILGYVVRWVDQGVGCSKVPDMSNVALMEDRATLRISSQLLANWLVHGICDEQQVMDAMKRMARIVDEQNSSDPLYTPMAPSFDGVAFKSACALVIEGAKQPSGYTEPLLHAFRLEAKAQA